MENLIQKGSKMLNDADLPIGYKRVSVLVSWDEYEELLKEALDTQSNTMSAAIRNRASMSTEPPGFIEAMKSYCGSCHRCLNKKTGDWVLPLTSLQMVVCSECGNKRCPKATSHELNCTRSNEPGQIGSIYGGNNE